MSLFFAGTIFLLAWKGDDWSSTGIINEHIIIINTEMMDESSASESDKRSLGSGATEILPSAYATLS
jgi:hypothetical protein